MKAAAIAITLCILFNTVQEAESLEKKALSLVQRTPASDLDPSLPNVSLNIWFNQVVGPRAGIVWQLSECGEANTEPDIDRPDLLACMQANAILSNGCKVVLA
ncbi:MAG: hypothetical protein J2P31_12765, partial [Blastocatellia bacterium]|nr:hypothetical protein [Blastocatellia bacterium]